MKQIVDKPEISINQIDKSKMIIATNDECYAILVHDKYSLRTHWTTLDSGYRQFPLPLNCEGLFSNFELPLTIILDNGFKVFQFNNIKEFAKWILSK